MTISIALRDDDDLCESMMTIIDTQTLGCLGFLNSNHRAN